MKIVFLFDPQTNEYLGSYSCPASPEEPGQYLIPIHCLEVEPMQAVQGKAIVATGEQWQQINDVRGIWFKPNGELVELLNLNDSPESGWTRQPPTPVIPPKTQFTSLEFLDRFTDDEQLAVVQATMASPQVKLWYDRLLAASFIDIADPRTEGGIDALITAGLIDPGRKTALLTPEEQP